MVHFLGTCRKDCLACNDSAFSMNMLEIPFRVFAKAVVFQSGCIGHFAINHCGTDG